MKKIKSLNGYTIYQLTARDEKNGEGNEGEYNIYFSSDVREFGREYSDPEFTGVDSLEVAEELCGNNYAIAKELCEAESTCVSFEEIEEKEKELDNLANNKEGEEMTKEMYYYGNKVSEYGQEHKKVDYATFAKAFNHVLNNDIMGELEKAGYYFEQIGGFVDHSEEIDELQEQIDELEELDEITEEIQEKIDALQEQIDELEEEQEPGEIFQYFIVDDNRILEENNEIVFYCEALDLYIWGVTHWGTSWDYVLTDISYNDDGYLI